MGILAQDAHTHGHDKSVSENISTYGGAMNALESGCFCFHFFSFNYNSQILRSGFGTFQHALEVAGVSMSLFSQLLFIIQTIFAD